MEAVLPPFQWEMEELPHRVAPPPPLPTRPPARSSSMAALASYEEPPPLHSGSPARSSHSSLRGPSPVELRDSSSTRFSGGVHQALGTGCFLLRQDDTYNVTASTVTPTDGAVLSDPQRELLIQAKRLRAREEALAVRERQLEAEFAARYADLHHRERRLAQREAELLVRERGGGQ